MNNTISNNDTEQINLEVQGMHCTTCALTIGKQLEKKGLQNVKVNYANGRVSFNKTPEAGLTIAQKEIKALGYTIVNKNSTSVTKQQKPFLSTTLQKFWFCFVFTLPLFIAHIVHIHALMNPYVQLGLVLPVYVVGMDFFGRSAIRSLLKGVPNMNVLIALGSTAAFGYSLYGLIIGKAHEFMFFETAATTITLVFLGNYMEDASIERTQDALKQLATSQKVMANMIAFDDKHEEQIFPVESKDLRVGDLILIRNGEQVPIDCKILWGDASVNEAIITGESVPVEKRMNDKLIGGSVMANGTVKAQVTATGDETVLAHIIKMVQDAQAEKPPMQQMADRISAIFVPAVVSIALLTIVGNYFIGNHLFGESLLRGIAVLVISCPCAMGLATPAAIAVGLGRAAKNGILFKNARSLEIFKNIKQAVFDKTGTLTTGKFAITHYEITQQGNEPITEEEFKRIAFSLEKYSNHPVGRCITNEWKQKNEIRWANIEEVKGLGMKATDKDGNTYVAGSYKAAKDLTTDVDHNIFIIRNNQLLGWIDVADDIRPEAKTIIAALHAKNIKTILLSGDKKEKCDKVAGQLGIDIVIADQTPEQKLQKIAELNNQMPTAMIGDGINDAPALAKATVGISLSDASQVAMQSAQVVLMNHGLKNLPMALGLGKHTYITIKENLFWAFAYNIVAIPVAAFGFLSPTVGALVMGLSDVVLAINSIRLKWKKVV